MKSLSVPLAVCLVWAALLCVPTFAGSTVNSEEPNPRVPAVRPSTPPVIDGDIGDACWEDAPVITGFRHDLEPASFETVVRVLCDDKKLYVSVHCFDPEPSKIIANQRKRNGWMWSDDNISIGLDPAFDRQNAYWFTVNPLGTQAEDIPGGAATKVEWRGDWHAAARIVADGWTVEMAIPYSILRYPRGQRTFGLMISREIERLSEGSNWPALTHYHVHTNQARWEPIPAPRYRPRPIVMPYALAGTGTIDNNAGVDIKYTAENNLTSLLTVSPDFATIEDAIDSVDFSYSPRYLSDRRPFFTEGYSFFGPSEAFYSRMIGPLDAGWKSFGKLGPWSMGGLATSRLGDETNYMGQVGYDPSPTWGVWGGAVGHNRSSDEGIPAVDNGVWYVGARHFYPLELNGVYSSVQYMRSHTAGAKSDGDILEAHIERYAGDGVFEWQVHYKGVSPDYDARLGYIPNVGYREVSAYTSIEWQKKQGPLTRWGVHSSSNYASCWNGSMWHRAFSPNVGLVYRNNTSFNAGVTMEDRRDPASGLLFRDRVLNLSYTWRSSDIYQRGNVFLRYGDLAGGPYWFVDASQGFRVNSRLSGNVGGSGVHLEGATGRLDAGRIILNAVYEFSPEKSLLARLIDGRQNDGTSSVSLRNAYLAYRQELRKGADIFVILGDPNRPGIRGQAAVKYVRMY